MSATVGKAITRSSQVITRMMSNMYPYEDDGSNDNFEHISRPVPVVGFAGSGAGSSRATEDDSPKPLLTKDGKVPEVVYSVTYVGAFDAHLQTIDSLEPFDEIPEYKDDKRPGSVDGEKPIIQIITKVTVGSQGGSFFGDNSVVSGSYAPPPARGPRGRRQQLQANDAVHTVKVMEINSEHLVNAIAAVVEYYPQFQSGGGFPGAQTVSSGSETSKNRLVIEAPYRVLVHHREALAAYRDNQPSWHGESYASTTARHIDVLLRTLNRLVGENLRLEDERLRRSVPMGTYENLWYIMRPGEVVLVKNSSDVWQPYVVSGINPGHGQFPSVVNCWQLSFNGWGVQRMMAGFEVSPWLGEQAVQSLSVIPAKYFPDDLDAQNGKPILELHAELGRTYWQLMRESTYMEYDGMLVNGINMQFQGPTGFMRGRVICDIIGFTRYANRSPRQTNIPPPFIQPPPAPVPPPDHLPHFKSRCTCAACHARSEEPEPGTYFGFDGQKPATPPASDLFFIAFTKIMPAFLLGERRWGHLNLAHVKPVKCDKEAFRYLVLDEEVKHTVKALIGKFAADMDGQVSPWGNDFVKNKGEGRIFLLHGSPGVGKTCTAECVAELTNRPLISLTSGDLGVDPFNVERSLSYFLELGQRYGALVLLDEADVYLERRQSSDISRNGLVSVFLRALEYYRGVLFLTTNRVRVFDSAFISRVHIALHYKDLTDQDRERIWGNNFERLDRESCGRVHVSVATREYAYQSQDVKTLGWNGREIRNAMQTALALAESDAADEGSDKITIMDKHLRAVVRMSRGFRDFLAQDEEEEKKKQDENGGDQQQQHHEHHEHHHHHG